MNPSVGRIVHYQRENLGLYAEDAPTVVPVAAIITQVHNNELVNLTLFPGSGGIEYLTSVRVGDEGEANTWIWPPQV